MGGKRKKGRNDSSGNDLSDTDSMPDRPDEMDLTPDDPRSTLAATPALPADPSSSSTNDSGSASASARSLDPTTDPCSSSASASAGPSTGAIPRSAWNPNPDSSDLNPLGSYVVVTPTSPDVSFRKINVFWPEKQIRAICGVSLDHEAPANGTLIIKTQKRSQTKLLLATTVFCDKQVNVSLHQTRNSVKGTIFAPELRHMSEEEIVEGLADQQVTHVHRMTTFRDGQKRDTSVLAVTFNLLSLPDHLYAGRLRYQVRHYIPNPLRCFRCQQYGHGSRNCERPARCRECGENLHSGSPCTAPKQCIACKRTDHSVDSKDCPHWKREKEICAVKVKENVSYPEARRLVDERMPSPASGSYAQAATPAKQPTPSRPQTRSCSTQADLLPGIPPLQLLPPRSATTSIDTITDHTQTPAPLLTRSAAHRSESRPRVTSGPQRDRSRSPAPQAMVRPRPGQTQPIGGRPTTRSRDPIPTRTPATAGPASDHRSRPAIKVAPGRARSVSQTRTQPNREGFWEVAQTGAGSHRK